MTYTPYLTAALVVLGAAFLGLSQTLGAHPFWATKIALIGVPIGLVAALILSQLGNKPRLVLFAVLLIATSLAAHLGKREFAASFAENTTAGTFWYFGWIGIAASATAVLASLLAALISRRSSTPDTAPD